MQAFTWPWNRYVQDPKAVFLDIYNPFVLVCCLMYRVKRCRDGDVTDHFLSLM